MKTKIEIALVILLSALAFSTPALATSEDVVVRAYLTIHLDQVSDSKDLTSILAKLTRSITADDFGGNTCHLDSYVDTLRLHNNDFDGTWVLRVRAEEDSDCSAQGHWIDDQLNTAKALPGVEVEEML